MINRRMLAIFWTLALAVLALHAQAQPNPNFEYNVDRPGGDYRNFELQFDAPGLCAGQCAQEAQCKAWTYVKAGVQGQKARCWLKSVVPQARSSTATISGLARGATAQPPAPPPTRVAGFVGCFKDTNDFDLKGHLERSAQNSPQRCISVCQARGFAYAGVQYGESCLCGNSYGKYGAANNCNYACTGDRNQVCGGYSANSVYATGVTVARPPPPPPVTPPPPPNATRVTWYTKGNSSTLVGQRVSFLCPPLGPDGYQSIWGTDVYTYDSGICLAGAHVGVITRERGGVVTIEKRPGQSTFPATTRNGIASQGYASYSESFAVGR